MAADARFREDLLIHNGVYREYRQTGYFPDLGNPTIVNNLRQEHVIQNRRQLPNPHPLRFFLHNNSQSLPRYEVHSTANRDPALETDLRAFFQGERHVFQRVLGVGAGGLVAHFRDRGPSHDDDPGRDFVVKVGRNGWNSDSILREKMMMRKVKGSAHCIQAIDPHSIGIAGNESRILDLDPYDSSVDEESSGNDSLNERQVRSRYRVKKRSTRTARYWKLKIKRKEKRTKEIKKKNEKKGKSKSNAASRDYIIMEYMHNGSLSDLINKLAQGAEDEPPNRVPNRVLWGFWLCLVRGCVAMEYPPRKFHPMRKERTGNVSYLQAKASGMIRALRALGVPFLDQATLDRHAKVEGDMVEEIPDSEWKRLRRMNLVHRDIDPQNIFVNGFELDRSDLEDWSALTRYSGFFQYTERRPDRINQEHQLVPRLKIGDFGQAACIKREKRNTYYSKNRFGGKLGNFPPEIFGPEWEKVEGGADGDYLANSRTCGYFSNKTNIWCIAMSMWQLIVQKFGPTPPTPQPPDELLDDPDVDSALRNPQYANFRISYCDGLLDPDVNEFDWVDRDLRQTIFECMYHRPDDRPSLEQLLTQAKEKIQEEFQGENDNLVREWFADWFYDAILPSPASSAAGFSSLESTPPVPGNISSVNQPIASQSALEVSQLMATTAQSSDVVPSKLRQQRILATEFPNGWTRIQNQGMDGLQCGLFAIADSLQHQLGQNPTINGVPYNLNSLPRPDDLRTIYRQLSDSGEFNDFHAEDDPNWDKNFSVDLLGRILIEWGRTVNLE
ncbi:hypothetical protein F5Y08DRAFT_347477 [Xylaria arbuscula]|nr:hypothetical protein F5Y08DRAFT_347477 [Xylaria arbuscula]